MIRLTLVAAALVLATLASAADSGAQSTKTALFAGGCFWCMEPPYDKLEGVISTTSGYAGGKKPNPTYEEVSTGGTGHYEVVRIEYDPAKVSYEKLLQVFWHNIDPHDGKGQFCDTGPQYRAAIFALDDEQKKLAEASKDALAKSGKLKAKIVTEVLPAATFYPAEDYHQDYYVKSAARYKLYRWNCGRDARLKEVWGDAAGG